MVIDFIVSMILVIGAVSLFNLTRYILKVRKLVKKYKDNPNIEGITIVNGEIKVIEKDQVQIEKAIQPLNVEMVTDPICHKEIEKSEAYRMVKEDKEYFFCSWECREQFLKQQEEGI